ncbi:MAG: hypothetical protein GY816_23330 [Cytophagales bacterium]|nr:hypothetical protein [Cytophagales bacterium]
MIKKRNSWNVLNVSDEGRNMIKAEAGYRGMKIGPFLELAARMMKEIREGGE